MPTLAICTWNCEVALLPLFVSEVAQELFRLTEPVSSLGNGPHFVSQTTIIIIMHNLFSVARLQPFLAHTRF